ncbi:MAG: ribosomal-protein-alanine N-acetyltransferase [Methanosarcinales archaeon]|nr:MAG: ribosomal-protein-alanine N-acetyltransferase [Methanosarcinales archaeon]
MTDVITIRNFRPRDFQKVLDIEYQAFNEHRPDLYMQFYELNADTFLVAEWQVEIVGFIVGIEFNGIGKVFSIAVHRNYQKKNIGSILLNAIACTFKSKKINEIYLEVRESNYSAYSFYKKHGFVSIGAQPSYYSDGENAVIMKKILY